jgi:hypothetical protein
MADVESAVDLGVESELIQVESDTALLESQDEEKQTTQTHQNGDNKEKKNVKTRR